MLSCRKKVWPRIILFIAFFPINIFAPTLADTNALTRIDGFGRCSRIAIANHTSFAGQKYPFYLFANSLDGGVILKEMDPATGAYKAIDAQQAFDSVKDVDVEIDDYKGPVFKWAVSAKTKTSTPNGVAASLQYLQSFPTKSDSQGPIEIQDKSQPFGRHYLGGLASESRVYAKASKLLFFKDGFAGPKYRSAYSRPGEYYGINYTWLGDKINNPDDWIDLGDGSQLEYWMPSAWDPANPNPADTNAPFLKKRKFGDDFDAQHKGLKITNWTDFYSSSAGNQSGMPHPFLAGKPFIYGGTLAAINCENFAIYNCDWYDSMFRSVPCGWVPNDYALPTCMCNVSFFRLPSLTAHNNSDTLGASVILNESYNELSPYSDPNQLASYALERYNPRSAYYDFYTRNFADKKIMHRDRYRGISGAQRMLYAMPNFFTDASMGMTRLLDIAKYDTGQILSETDRLGKVPDRYGNPPDRGVAYLADITSAMMMPHQICNWAWENTPRVTQVFLSHHDPANAARILVHSLSPAGFATMKSLIPSVVDPYVDPAIRLNEYTTKVLATFPSINNQQPMSDADLQKFFTMFPELKPNFYDPIFNRFIGDINLFKKRISEIFYYFGQMWSTPLSPEERKLRNDRGVFVIQTRAFTQLWHFWGNLYLDSYLYDLATSKYPPAPEWSSLNYAYYYRIAKDHDFSKAVRLKISKRGNAFYIATILNDDTFEITAVTNPGKNNELSDSVIIPVQVQDIALDNTGYIAIVDKDGYLWIGNVDKLLTSSASFNPALVQALVENAQATSAAAQAAYQANQAKLDALKAQEAALRQQLTAFPAGTALDQTKTLEQQLQDVLKKMQDAIIAAKQTAADAKAAVTQLSLQLQKLKQDNAAAEATKASLDAQQASLLAEQKTLTDKRNQDLARFNLYTSALEKGLAGLGIAAGSISLKLDMSADQFATAMQKVQEQILAAIKLKNDTIAGLESTNKTLQSDIANISLQVEALKASTANTAAEVAAKQQQLADLQNLVLQNQNTLKEKDALIQQNTAQIDLLKQAKTQYTTKLNEVLAAVKSMDLGSDSAAVLNAQADNIGSIIQQLLTSQDSQISSLTTTLNDLKLKAATSKEDTEKLTQQIIELKNQQANVLKEKADLLTSLTKSNDEAKEKIKLMQEEINALSAAGVTDDALAKKQADIDKLRESLSKYNSDLIKEQDAQTALNNSITGFNKDIQAFLTARNISVDQTGTLSQILKNSLDQLKQTAARQKAIVQELEANIAIAEAEKASALKALDGLINDSTTSTTDTSVAERITVYANLMKENLLQVARSREADRNSLLIQLSQAQAEFDALLGSSSTTIGSVQDVDSAAAARTKRIAELQATREAFQAQLDALSGQLKSDKEKFEKVLTDMQLEIDAINARADAIKTEVDNVLNSPDFASQSALVTNTKTVSSTDDLLTKFSLILEVKDKLIAQMQATLDTRKAQVKKDIDTLISKFGVANSPEVLALQDQTLSLDQKLVKAKEFFDKQMKDMEAKIAAYTKTAAATKATVNALFAAGAGDVTGLSQAEIDLAKNPDVNIKDLVPLLTKFLANKDAAIADYQNKIKDKKDYITQQTALQNQMKLEIAQKTKELDTYKAMEQRMQAKLTSEAGLAMQGVTGTLQYSANASLQEKFDQIMEFRKVQIQNLKAQFDQEKADLKMQLADVSAQIDSMSAETAGLTVLNANQRAQIDALTKTVDDLQAKIVAKDQEIAAVKVSLDEVVARLQSQIDTMNDRNTKLKDQIELLELKLKDQQTTLAEKQKIIDEKDALINRYQSDLAEQQRKTAMLAADVETEQKRLKDQQAALQAQKDKLAASQSAQDLLRGEMQAIIDERAKVEAINKAQVEQLTKLAELRKARVAELEQREQLLMNQVSVLSSIIDQHLDFNTDLSDVQQAAVIQAMGSQQGELVKKMLTGVGLEEKDLAPYIITWMSQEVKKTANQATTPFNADLINKISSMSKVDEIINTFTTAPDKTIASIYQSLDPSIKTQILSFIPDIESTLGQDELAFKMNVHTKILASLKGLIKPAVDGWTTSTNADAADKKSKDTLTNLLNNDPATMKLSVVKVKLNVLFEQKKAMMELQKQNYEQAMKNLEVQVESSKTALADAIKQGAANLDQAKKQLEDLTAQKEKKLQDQKDVLQKMSAIYTSRLEGTTAFSMSLLKRQSSDATLSKNIEFFNAKRSELMATIEEIRKAVTAGQAAPDLLTKATQALDVLNRNFAYSPYILPLSLLYSPDGKIVRATKLVNKSGQEVVSGTEEIGVSETITLSWTDSENGLVPYVDPSLISTTDNKVHLSLYNRFDERLRMKVVNQGYNLVSFEVDKEGKTYVLTLTPSSTPPPPMPDGLQQYGRLLANYDVRWQEKSSPLSDQQKFYVEGLSNPAYSEAVIIRAFSSENNYANDMHGYLSVNMVSKGVYELIYKPYISPDYHSQPRNKETIMCVHQMDLASGSEEAVVTDFINKLMQLDDKEIIDPAKGFTQADKALEKLLETQVSKIQEIYNNGYRFEDFVLNITDFVGLLSAKGELSEKDFKQLREFGKKLQSFVIDSDASNLKKGSAGYKALIGTYDLKGRLSVPGLVNQGDATIKATFEDGDFIVLSNPDGFMLRPGDFVGGKAAIIMSQDNSFNTAYNLKLQMVDQNKFKVLSHDGMLKLIFGTDFVGFKATADENPNDVFTIQGSLGSIALINSSGAYLVPDKHNKDKVLVSADAATNLTPAEFSFTSILRKKNTYEAVLLDAGETLQGPDGRSIEVILLQELAKNRSKLNEILRDMLDFVAFNITDKNRTLMQNKIQIFTNAIMADADFVKQVDEKLLDELSNKLSLFDVNKPTFFLIRAKDGSVLRISSKPCKRVLPDSTTQVCYGLEFVSSELVSKNCFFRVVPNPNRLGSYFIVGYASDQNSYYYLTATKDRVTDSNDAPLPLSFITGSSAQDYMDDNQSLSGLPDELFEISGIMGTATIRSLSQSLQAPIDSGFLAIISDGQAQIPHAVDPTTKSLFTMKNDGINFDMKVMIDTEVAILTSTTPKLPITFYSALLAIVKDATLKDEEKTNRAANAIDLFKKQICDADASGALKIKKLYLDRNLHKLVTDPNNEVFSMYDVLMAINKYIRFDTQKGMGIKLTNSSQATLDALMEIFKTQDTMSFIQVNVDRVLKPGGTDLSIALTNLQSNLVALKPVIQDFITFITGTNVEFASEDSVVIKNIDTMIIRTDMPADIKTKFSSIVDAILANKSIKNSDLSDILNKLRVKFNPDLEVVGSKSAGPRSYSKMDLYAKLSLAEKMLTTGRYRDISTGLIVQNVRNPDEAEKILNTITDEEIGRSVQLAEFKAWIKHLRGLVPVVRRTTQKASSSQMGGFSALSAFSLNALAPSTTSATTDQTNVTPVFSLGGL